jgi:hypothetical protein
VAIEKPLFVIPADLGTIATGNQRTEAQALHLNLHRSPGLVWRSNGNSNLWARGQMAASTLISFASVLAANAQPGTTIRLRLGTSQAEVDGGSAPYDSGAVAFISPAVTRDGGLYHSHQRFSPISATWWRIDIGSHTGDFEAMSLVLGEAVQAERYYDRGFEFGNDDLGDVDYSRWGVVSETDGFVMRTLSFKLAWISEAAFEGQFRRIMNLTKRTPVFICFDPEATTYRQDKTYFGRFGQPPFATQGTKARNFIMEFAIKSMI